MEKRKGPAAYEAGSWIEKVGCVKALVNYYFGGCKHVVKLLNEDVFSLQAGRTAAVSLADREARLFSVTLFLP